MSVDGPNRKPSGREPASRPWWRHSQRVGSGSLRGGQFYGVRSVGLALAIRGPIVLTQWFDQLPCGDCQSCTIGTPTDTQNASLCTFRLIPGLPYFVRYMHLYVDKVRGYWDHEEIRSWGSSGVVVRSKDFVAELAKGRGRAPGESRERTEDRKEAYTCL